MTTTDFSLETWKHLVRAGGPQHRLVDRHPLHLYYGTDAVNRPTFFLISEVEPHPPILSGILTSEVRRRDDSKWAAVLTLNDNAYVDNFMGICVELSRRTRDEHSEQSAVAKFDTTLKQWQRLLAKMSLRPLSKEQMRGLFAELAFGNRLADASSPMEMLASWVGPRGASQDFRHPTFGLFEVKAIGSDARSVMISSVEQLDPPSGQDVALVVSTVDEDPLGKILTSRTLPQLITATRLSFGADDVAVDMFDDLIDQVGVDATDPRYAETRFHISASRCFVTAEDFPRLRLSSVPAGTEHVRYDLRLDAVAPYAVDLSSLLSAPQDDDRNFR